jgi:hypothetical protein
MVYIRSRKRNYNLSKVGTRTGTLLNNYGSATLLVICCPINGTLLTTGLKHAFKLFGKWEGVWRMVEGTLYISRCVGY